MRRFLRRALPLWAAIFYLLWILGAWWLFLRGNGTLARWRS